MFQTKSAPFDDDVEKATSENNLSEDWSLIMLICDNAINYQDGSKFCLKAITKRLHHNVPRVVMQALILLDACVKNCDKRFLLQVASSDFTTEIQKLLKKMHPSAAIKLKELLQKWSMEEFKVDPELCIIPSLYYKLKSEGVEFPPLENEKKPPTPICTDPNAVTSQEEENDIIKALEISLKDTGKYSVTPDVGVPEFARMSEPVMESFKARAIFDFEAVEDNELTIQKGEIVLVLDNSNSNWWKGSNHRGEGLFPANFVTDDLDFNPPVDEVEALTVEEEIIDTPDEPVTINEEKIDKFLNWINDVDPTEDLSDPEDMLKLEKECFKMVPLIEENLQAIDLRLAKLDETNVKIMEAFDLFHELSDNRPVLSSNMKLFPNTMQTSLPQHTLPNFISTMQSSLSNTPSSSTMPAETSRQDGIPNPGNSFQQVTGPKMSSTSQASATDIPAATQTSNDAIAVTNPLINQVVHPGAMMNPYGGNMVGGYFVPPGAPFPFMPNIQQGYPPMPFPVTTPPFMPPFMGMPIHPPGAQMPNPYYYLNNAPVPTNMQSNATTTISNSQQLPTTTQNVTLNTSTAASSIPSTTSVSSYSSDLQQMTTIDATSLANSLLKQDTTQTASNQASGDGQSSSNSSSENS